MTDQPRVFEPVSGSFESNVRRYCGQVPAFWILRLAEPRSKPPAVTLAEARNHAADYPNTAGRSARVLQASVLFVMGFGLMVLALTQGEKPRVARQNPPDKTKAARTPVPEIRQEDIILMSSPDFSEP